MGTRDELEKGGDSSRPGDDDGAVAGTVDEPDE